MKDILKLVLTAVRQTKRFFKDGAEVQFPWKSNAWGGLLEQLTKSEKYGQASGLQAMCKQVRDATDATRVSEPCGGKKTKKLQEVVASSEKPSKSKAKRKAEEVDAPSERSKKPKKTKVVTEIS